MSFAALSLVIMKKILETDRLILRHLLPEDLERLFALYSDEETRRYFPEGTLTYAETKEERDSLEIDAYAILQ